MHATDWFPTINKLAGVDPTTKGFPLDGFDVWDVITKKTQSPRNEIMLNYDSVINTAALIFGNYKIVVGPQPFNDWYPVPTVGDKLPSFLIGNVPNITLYDIAADPSEKNDIAPKNPDVVQKLLARIETYARGSVKPAFPNPDVKSNPANFGGYWTPWQ